MSHCRMVGGDAMERAVLCATLSLQGVYYIAVSGVLYDIIRGVPFVGADSRGNPIFINPNSGTQFGAEGMIVGTLST